MDDEYQSYLTSEAWASKRTRKILESGSRCAACGSNRSLQVHHLTYERIFHEPLEDLMMLCSFHHKATEKAIANGILSRVGDVQELAEKTLKFLQSKHKRKHKPTIAEINFEEAARNADLQITPPINDYPKDVQRLLRICAELQKSAGDFAFFISVRQAAEVLGLQSRLHTANAILAKLVSDGILQLVKRGTRHKASEYRLP